MVHQLRILDALRNPQRQNVPTVIGHSLEPFLIEFINYKGYPILKSNFEKKICQSCMNILDELFCPIFMSMSRYMFTANFRGRRVMQN